MIKYSFDLLTPISIELLLFKLCNQGTIVDRAIRFLESNIGKAILGPLIKQTVFLQFTAGEDLKNFSRVAQRWKTMYSVNTIIDQSIEDTESDEGRVMNFHNKLSLIKNASDINIASGMPLISFVPIKCSSMIPPSLLERITKDIGEAYVANIDQLSIRHACDTDLKALRSDIARLQHLCEVLCVKQQI